MGLQTQNLVMIALSVLGDSQPSPLQPPLVNGIHLRWAFNRALGFPWYGFSLFRRESQKGSLLCLSQVMPSLPVGPRPSNTLDLPYGQVSSDSNLALTNDFPPAAVVEFDLRGRRYLRFTLSPGNIAHRVEVRLGLRFERAEVEVVALLWETPVARSVASGSTGEVVTVILESDAITAVPLGAGAAALVDLCFVPISQQANVGWTPMPPFSYPLCLPVTHPDYPCTPGLSEDLPRARTLARQRIRYGDPGQFTPPPVPMQMAGSIAVANGSPLVKGAGTSWGPNLIGAVLQVNGDPTAYTIMTVVASNKLVLSRNYAGASRTGATYVINHDAFGQFYDQLIQLVTGGSAAGPMENRFIPVPIASGMARVRTDDRTATSIGTSLTDEVVGFTLEVVDAEVTIGTVTVTHGSPLVMGTGTTWGPDLIGLRFQIPGERALYTITHVDTTTQLMTLDQGYAGTTGSGKAYSVVEKTPYVIQSISPTSQQLTLDRGYTGETGDIGTPKAYTIVGRMQPEEPGEVAPLMPRQYPLDLVLLATLHPAVAQMAGLYWVDQSANPAVAYDYVIVADYEGQASRSPGGVWNWIAHHGFDHLEAYIVFNKKMAPSPALAAPDDVRVYALPGGTIRTQPCVVQDATNNAGLRWNRGMTALGALLPGHPIMYHLWRADLGNGVTPTTPGVYNLLTKDHPILPVESQLEPTATPQFPDIWPPFSLHAIDTGLGDGWYSYQVSGIDIFGRHSANSVAAQWWQWVPRPEPPPRYYQDPPGDRAIHPFAVHLLDELPPPSPTGIEAYALDPLDPTVLKDAAYTAWWNALTASSWYQALPEEEKKNLIGLRVRWLWTYAHSQQAPDTREFRLYYHPGRMNTLLGHTRSVTAVSSTESAVETDMSNPRPANAYLGAWLQIGPDSFEIVASEAANPLRVQVKSGPVISSGVIAAENGSPKVTGTQTNWDKTLTGFTLHIAGEPIAYTILKVEEPPTQQLTLDRGYVGPTGGGKAYTITGKLPRANAPCTVVIPPVYAAGTIAVVSGSPTVTGVGTNWDTPFAGSAFQVVGDATTYTIMRVDAPTQLVLDRGYEGNGSADTRYIIRHPPPFFDDYTVPTTWEERYYVVSYDEHVTETVPPLPVPDGRALSGTAATVAGTVISLDGSPDLSGSRLTGEHLFLAHDSNRPAKSYCITAIDDNAKTVTVDGMPTIGGVPSPWVIGFPLRTYEVFLPDPSGTFRRSLPLTPTLADPLTYAHIGISAADDKPHTLDDPQWLEPGRGGWGGSDRYGNEGPVGPPAQIFRVWREPPPAPVPPPPDSDRVYASPADYHGHSFYTYRWKPAVDPGPPETILPLHCHLFRALDNTLFQIDWSRRPRIIPLDSSQSQFFPDAVIEPRWDMTKRQQVADELNQLNNFSHDSGTAQAMAYYRSLSNDGLRVLAGLPGNERAFTQLTIKPLDPADPANADTMGPDSPDNYVPNPSLRCYVDKLDGRAARNRYFYRAAYVDSVHNRSDLSLSTVPIYLRNVVPPRAPAITKVLGGDRQVALQWASNRESDLVEYRVYRAESEASARDLRLMTLIHIEAVLTEDPEVRVAEVNWTDTVPSSVTLYYRLVAVDEAGNLSLPSPVVAGRAFDDSRPNPPTWNPPVSGPNPNDISLSWTSPVMDLSCMVERQVADSMVWESISRWLPRGIYTYTDTTRIPGLVYLYRLRVRDSSGKSNRDFLTQML